MFTWEQRWFPSLNRNQGNVSSLRLKRERWKEEEEHPQMNKSNASAFVSWYVPLEPSSSNAFWLPLPSTAKNHLPCYLGGVGRQMNGPMALSVGRVKEANKQKTAAEVQWDVVRKQRRKSTPASGWVFMRRWVKRATNPHIPCELNRSLWPGFLVSCLCKRDAVERWKYVCRCGQATVLVTQPKLNCWMDYKWKANQILWLFTASATTKTDKWGLKAV